MLLLHSFLRNSTYNDIVTKLSIEKFLNHTFLRTSFFAQLQRLGKVFRFLVKVPLKTPASCIRVTGFDFPLPMQTSCKGHLKGSSSQIPDILSRTSEFWPTPRCQGHLATEPASTRSLNLSASAHSLSTFFVFQIDNMNTLNMLNSTFQGLILL